MNALPKFVATRTLEHLVWNAQPLGADLAAALHRLKEEPGQDLLVFGSTTLANALHALNLVDEYRLLVYPVVLGGGKRLFAGDVQAKLTLTKTQRLGEAVLCSYAPR